MIEGSCHCGAVRWTFEGAPESATACNCTACRRYGTLWAYGFDGEGVEALSEPEALAAHVRGDGTLAFHFCRHCGCVTHWRGLRARADGRTRIAVNLRMAEPDAVAHIPIQRFDGLLTWEDLPRDGRCIADVWY